MEINIQRLFPITKITRMIQTIVDTAVHKTENPINFVRRGSSCFSCNISREYCEFFNHIKFAATCNPNATNNMTKNQPEPSNVDPTISMYDMHKKGVSVQLNILKKNSTKFIYYFGKKKRFENPI